MHSPGVLSAEALQGCSRGPVTARGRNIIPFVPAGVLLCSLYELIFPLWVLAPSPVTSSASPARRDPGMCRGSRRAAGDHHLPVLEALAEFLLLLVPSKLQKKGPSSSLERVFSHVLLLL